VGLKIKLKLVEEIESKNENKQLIKKLTYLGGYWARHKNRKQFFDDYARSNGFDPLIARNWHKQPYSKFLTLKVIPFLLQFNSLKCQIITMKCPDLLYAECILDHALLSRKFSQSLEPNLSELGHRTIATKYTLYNNI
jgi:hypothetical protein